MAQTEKPSEVRPPTSTVPPRLRIAATILRSIFICTLLVITLRVSAPQSETVWSAYETPADLVRMALGLAVCVWLVIQLFNGPQDVHGYRTWFYLGLAAVPFALICLVGVW